MTLNIFLYMQSVFTTETVELYDMRAYRRQLILSSKQLKRSSTQYLLAKFLKPQCILTNAKLRSVYAFGMYEGMSCIPFGTQSVRPQSSLSGVAIDNMILL